MVNEQRDATAADDAARDALHLEAFGFAPPAGMWAWKYRANPHGAAIERVALDGDRVAAAFALVPRRFRRGTRDLLAFQAADAMTAAPARRRGHFARLLASCEAQARARGGAFLFAFGGARSNTSFARAGWTSVRGTRFALAELRGVRAWLRGRLRDAAPFVVTNAAGGDGGDGDAARGAEDLFAGVRDPAWRAWRCASPRYVRARAASGEVAVVETWSARAVLSDLWPPRAWHRDAALWRGLFAALRARGASTIEMSLVEGEELARTADRAGLRSARGENARPLWVKPLAEAEAPAWFQEPALWLRDLDRDAEGLLLRAVSTPDRA